MDLMLMLILAVVSTLTTIIAFLRFVPWRVMMKYHGLFDVIFTVIMLFLFAGTLQGMVIAIIAGLFFSMVLSFGKMLTPRHVYAHK